MIINRLFFYLSVNEIGVKGACAIRKILQGNSMLTSLNLKCEEAVVQSCKIELKNNQWLHGTLPDNVIGDHGANTLGRVFRVNQILTSLDLSCEG